MSRRWISGLLASLFVLALFVAMPAPKANAVLAIEPTGETPGDVAIFPFYDVSSDTKYNYFYLVNTVNYWLQVHLRFRTMECSIECLDFDIIMSPYDVFVFWVMPDIDGLGPGFYSDDSNTIDYSGLMPAAWKSGSPTIAKTPFDDSRLLDLHISQDDTQDMLKKGYVVAIVEGLIDKTFWSKCGPFKSLVVAAKTDLANSCAWDKSQNGTWHDMNADLDNVGKAGHYFPANGNTWETVGDANIQQGTIIYGNEYFLDFGPLTGYGVNAATIAGFRVYNSSDTDNTPGPVSHLDDNFTVSGSLKSGMNGLVLHPDYYGSNTNDNNPFFRPDWATTFGPTLAYGDDFDDGSPLVYGSVDDIEENFYANMMDEGSRYAGHYLSALSSVYTYVLLNFFTKHYHYFTKLLYDPRDPSGGNTFTHGYVASGKYHAMDRKVDTDYNFNLPTIAPCNTDYWNVKFRWQSWDISENLPPGQVSPGTLVSFNKEAELLEVGPGADKLNTGSFTNGWFKLGDFRLDVDDARAEQSYLSSKPNFIPINVVTPLEIYDIKSGEIDTVRYIFAIGYSYVDIPGYGQWKWNLTILDSPKGPSPQP